MNSHIIDYYRLTKPGIIRGNIIASLAGFFLASRGEINIQNLVFLVIGLSMVIASACVFNNILDRSLDSKMLRTRKRAMVEKRVSVKSGVIYGISLGFAGFIILAWFTTVHAVVLAFIAHFLYVFVYGYAKRVSHWGTLVGAFPGSLPPVIGYTAVTGALDIIAFGLFILLFVWQMPHFYAIAIFRKKDYQSAGIPVLTIVRGNKIVTRRILYYVYGLLAVTLWFGFISGLSMLYFILSVTVVIFWLRVAYKNATSNDLLWSKKMFGASLIVLLTLCIAISLDSSLIN